jgi:predicted nucleic acid-binding protein
LTRIFLDTSVLSHKSLGELANKLADHASQGDELLISVLTHFEVLWGYRKANLVSSHYEEFLEKLRVDVAPLLEEDAAFAAGKKPGKEKLVDALIAATVTRYDAFLWTKDRDFNQFLPEEKVTIL